MGHNVLGALAAVHAELLVHKVVSFEVEKVLSVFDPTFAVDREVARGID